MTELRVVPLRVGGKGPTVQLSCDGEDEPFTVEASLADARALGSLLQRAVDVTLTLRRDHAGRIDAGRILEVSPLDEGDPGDAWRRWFAADAVSWDEVDDIQAELGRA
jgi:hypothetical protein